MNKQELIDLLAKENGLSKADAKYIVNLTFQSMTNTLAHGDRVEIRGLGSFVVRKYRAYKGRNPKTGEVIKVKRKKLPFFKVGKELKDRVNS
jgi:integration host factor subunit beta